MALARADRRPGHGLLASCSRRSIVAGVGVSMAIPAAQNSVVGSVADGGDRQGGGRQQHDARARRRVRDRGRRRGLRRRRQLRLARRRSSTASRRRSPSPRASRSLGAIAGLALPGRRAVGAPLVARVQEADVNETGHGPLQGQARSRRRRTRRSCAPSTTSSQRTAPDGLRYATFRLDDGVSFVHLADDRGRAQPAGRGRGVRALPGGHPRPLRRAAGRHRAARGRVLSRHDEARMPPLVPPRAAHGRPARARARSTRSSAAGARSGSTPAAPYLALELGGGFGGGIVECATRAPGVAALRRGRRVDEATDARARLGASVLLEPREGPAGWRSVVAHARGRRDRVLAAEGRRRCA